MSWESVATAIGGLLAIADALTRWLRSSGIPEEDLQAAIARGRAEREQTIARDRADEWPGGGAP